MSPVAPHEWIVLKFGGTSVSRRERWDTIGTLAARRADEEGARVLVVVSALGGVTNELQAIADGQDLHGGVAALARRHAGFCEELGLPVEPVLGERFDALAALAADPRAVSRTLDWQAEVLAQGELLSSTLGCAYLRSRGLDVGWCDARASLEAVALPNASAWADRLSVNCDTRETHDVAQRLGAMPQRILLTQGFIARHRDGGTAILGRGGSDTSAAYFGALLGARRLEIWTDVPGMFSANPREVPDARLLTLLDYAEAQEIAATGAKVLHPRSIAPCRDARVPMAILDTARPELPGTRIERAGTHVNGVKAISMRRGIVLVSMESTGMWQQVGFLADVFERFKRHGLSIDLIGASETNVTVSLDPSENLVSTDVLARLSEDLAQVCGLKVIVPCAAITLVGLGMRSLLHRLSGVWAAFGRERVHLITQSSDDLNLTFVLDEAQADGLLPLLHAELIRNGAMPVDETSVFGPTWREIVEGDPAREAPWWVAARGRLLERAEHGTPRYLYHLPTLRRQARRLAALDAIDARYFAMKANAHPEILRTLVEEGFGLECVSAAEIAHARACIPGLPVGKLLFTPSFAPRAEYQAAFDAGVHVTLDNVEALQRWPEVFRDRELWLRLDLGRGDGHHAKVVTGGIASKFGLPLARLEEFLSTAQALGVRVSGLHAHLGSGIDSPGHWLSVVSELAGIAEGIPSVETLDLGGGLPIPYRPGDAEFDIAAWGEGMCAMKAQFPRLRFGMEPGRYLVAQCGVLLTQVTQVVEKLGVRRIGLDGGMNALIRPALYDAWHGVHNLTRLDDGELAAFDVVGPICESSDVMAQGRRLPAATAEGDVVLVADAGAYGMAMANTYNLRALPAEDVLDD